MSQSPPAYAVPRPTKYCHACGSVIDAAAVVCPFCGVSQPGVPSNVARAGGPYGLAPLGDASDKRILVAFLLCFFAGVFGVHRFYAGKIGTGIVQLLTLGGLGLWALVDMILLVTGNFRDGEGRKITEWT